MVSLIVGAILMTASFNSAMAMYRMSSSGENQVLATNMAQQVIDNARNSTFTKLKNLLAGGNTVSQTINLYDYPLNPATSMFARPLLRDESVNSAMTYQDESTAKRFNGTVTETLTDLAPGAAVNLGLIKVDVLVQWKDSRSGSTGTHTYSTSTTIAETGIHNN